MDYQYKREQRLWTSLPQRKVKLMSYKKIFNLISNQRNKESKYIFKNLKISLPLRLANI